MVIIGKKISVLLCLFFLAGCYEDFTEITLNPDGSGSLKQKLIISERAIVAGAESSGNDNLPPISRKNVIAKVGSAIDITDIKQTELSDGSRAIEFEGTFSRPEQFFLSEFCRETLDLRISQVEQDKAAIYYNMPGASDSGPNIAQLYGMAKGMYIRRTIHLPAKILETNGKAEGVNTVSWIMDLRDRAGLSSAEAFVEGPDKGKGFVFFDPSALKFSLPISVSASSEDATELSQKAAQDANEVYSAKVAWVSLKKKMLTEEPKGIESSDLEIGIEVGWAEGHEPISFVRGPVLLTLLDDQNKDLVSSDKPSTFRAKLFFGDKKNRNKELVLSAETPTDKANKLKNLSGYVTLITKSVKEKLVLENARRLVGKDTTGEDVLDKLNFKIVSIEGNTVKIEIDGGNERITTFDVIKEDGSELIRSGGMGGGNEYSYSFREQIPEPVKFELEVITSENVVKVPFSQKEIPLP